VYKSFRGRQVRGILVAAAGATVGLLIFGARDAAGYGLTFLMAVPGFAYGYFQPEGKPVEYWFLVLLRYHFTPQMFGPRSEAPPLRRLYLRLLSMVRVARRAKRMREHEEVRVRGRR
jgi:hypothetical protein